MIFHGILQKQPETKAKFDKRLADEGEAWMHADWVVDHRYLVVGTSQIEVTHIKASLHAVSGVAAMRCRTYERSSSFGPKNSFTHFEGEVAGRTLSILFPNEPRPEKLILKIDSAQKRGKLIGKGRKAKGKKHKRKN